MESSVNLVTIIRFVSISSLLLFSISTAGGNENHLASCRSFYGRMNDLNLQQPPRRVLIIPLLSKDPHTNESPRWSEAPARTLETYYRNRFYAHVKILWNIWNWKDYYLQVQPLIEQSAQFDRVIFISHGGFDGPVMKNAVFYQNFEVKDGKGKLVQFSEAQPGLKNSLSITYDTDKNDVFSGYMSSHWPELAPMKTSDIWHLLKELEKQIQPLDLDCYHRYCSTEKLKSIPEQQRDYKIDLCELICRESLFELKTAVEISPERFFQFSNSLSELTSAKGMIFFGSCNPGSKAPTKLLERDETEFLIHSSLAGGPHLTYVHLVSAASGRITAGPIGQSSAEDIVNRIIMFESNQPQRHLCLISPEPN